jgi:hypothetical protein
MKSKAITLCLIYLTGLSVVFAQQTVNTKDYRYLFPEPISGWSASDVIVVFAKDNNKAKHGKIISLTRKYHTQLEADALTIYIIPLDYSLLSYTDKRAEQGTFELLGDNGYTQVSYNKVNYKSLTGVKYAENKNLVFKFFIYYSCLSGTLTFKTNSSGNSEKYVSAYLDRIDLNAIRSFVDKENKELNDMIKEMGKNVEIIIDSSDLDVYDGMW